MAIHQTVLLEAAPSFLTDDVFETAEYYRDKLGFSFETFYGDPPSFVILRRNAARLMFRQVPANARPAARPNHAKFAPTIDAYFWVSDVDALAAEFQARGATILDLPSNAENDSERREMIVRDNNDYHICFGRVIGWPH